ncbi:MAG: homocysteine S-methyltransferase family protein [Rhodospirillales bacterium]|nr:homocysteine S-methyltransferase family protein [Rhodospirillales bacterium]
MTYANVKDTLETGGVLILDAAIGTELERRGVVMDDHAWCGAATLTNLNELRGVHLDYIAAGADIITANTFASSRLMLDPAGLGDRVHEINKAAIETAFAARDEAGRPDVLVAGSLSHIIPVQVGSYVSDASDRPSQQQYADAFGELAGIIKECGCDLLLLEMMFDPEFRMRPAFEAAKSTGLPVWAGLSAKWADDGSIVTYMQDQDVPFVDAVKLAAEYDVDAMGVMHSPSDVTWDALKIVREHFDGPLTAYPDSGYFKMPHWQFDEVISPADLVVFAEQWKKDGVQVFGGCCGLSPEHIRAISVLKN